MVRDKTRVRSFQLGIHKEVSLSATITFRDCGPSGYGLFQRVKKPEASSLYWRSNPEKLDKKLGGPEEIRNLLPNSVH